MEIYKLTYNPFQENTFIISDQSKNCIIIDPGCYLKKEEEHLFNFISNQELTPLVVLNTHAHLDHIMGNQVILNKYPIDLYLHPADLPLFEMAEKSAQLYGLNEFKNSPYPNKMLSDKQVLSFGSIELEVIFGPGHSPGHVAFYNKENSFVINGDILFNGSYGRVDLPGGDFNVLKKTITERMFELPDNTTVYCGHGDETTIGKEKLNNPILW